MVPKFLEFGFLPFKGGGALVECVLELDKIGSPWRVFVFTSSMQGKL